MLVNGLKISRSWKGCIGAIFLYLLLCGLSIYLGQVEELAWSKPEDNIFFLGYQLHFVFPLFALIPLGQLLYILHYLFDAVLTINVRGLELRSGILSARQKIVRLRFEDIRGVEISASMTDRILEIGHISIGSAATEKNEIEISGIEHPEEIQELIQAERDRRVKARGSIRNFSGSSEDAVND